MCSSGAFSIVYSPADNRIVNLPPCAKGRSMTGGALADSTGSGRLPQAAASTNSPMNVAMKEAR
jgi:hypothetical protein